MSVSLQKKQPISLAKGLNKVLFTIEWDTTVDMDIHALMLSNGKAVSDSDFIFFGNLNHPNGCIKHSGDIRNGCLNAVGEEDETITVDLNKVPENRDEIIFTADIYNAANLGVDFSDVVGSVCKIINEETKEELGRFMLDRDLNGEICAKIGRLYKSGNRWLFEALGEGVPSLAQLLISSGLEVE